MPARKYAAEIAQFISVQVRIDAELKVREAQDKVAEWLRAFAARGKRLAADYNVLHFRKCRHPSRKFSRLQIIKGANEFYSAMRRAGMREIRGRAYWAVSECGRRLPILIELPN